MKRKKIAADNANVGTPIAPAEGVIDLDPASAPTEGFVAEVVAEERKRRTRKVRVARPEKPLVNADLIYEKAVEAFRAYFNDEQSQEIFEARIADLKQLQVLAEKVNAK